VEAHLRTELVLQALQMATSRQPPRLATDVGRYPGSASPYGTFDPTSSRRFVSLGTPSRTRQPMHSSWQDGVFAPRCRQSSRLGRSKVGARSETWRKAGCSWLTQPAQHDVGLGHLEARHVDKDQRFLTAWNLLDELSIDGATVEA
jgi:hypothetical protein